jgi:outer membrane protein OmpA-like peptidoglycan-associated protein
VVSSQRFAVILVARVKSKGINFFWMSFTDLMTSLFFVMLVLYVLTFVRLNTQKKITEEELAKVKEIQAAVKELPQEYFTYQSEFKRFALNRQIQFPAGDSEISSKDFDYLLNVGKNIQALVSRLKALYADDNIKYLIVIEGMASKDGYAQNDELSYRRSLALARLWERNKVSFDPNICELQIAGSGTKGIGRFSGDDEFKNQRFLIQIVPKIGDIEIK